MHDTHGDVGRPGDGDHVRALREEPRERDLARGRAVGRANLLEAGCELEDVREVLLGVPRNLTAEIIGLKVIWSLLNTQSSVRR